MQLRIVSIILVVGKVDYSGITSYSFIVVFLVMVLLQVVVL